MLNRINLSGTRDFTSDFIVDDAQLFIIISYEDLTAVHMRSCADDLCYFHLVS